MVPVLLSSHSAHQFLLSSGDDHSTESRGIKKNAYNSYLFVVGIAKWQNVTILIKKINKLSCKHN